MKALIGLLLLCCLVVSCKKKQTPQQDQVPTKWELVPGHYKVYDTTGVLIYEMNIEYSSGTSQLGYHIDSLHFDKLDNQFDLTIKQEEFANYPDMITTGVQTAIKDSNDNRWNLFCLSPDPVYNNLRNDTIIFCFQKQNMPYWLNDATPYFNRYIKQIAVKQK